MNLDHSSLRGSRWGWLGACLLAVLAAFALVPTASTAEAAPIDPELSTPFAVRTEGYTCFRIPALVTTRSGDLLAFAEGRVSDCQDATHIDIVMKRSRDGGAHWEPLTVIAGASDTLANGNPVPVVDAVTGRVSVMYAASTWTPATPKNKRGKRTLHVLNSVDGGATWTGGAALPHLVDPDWTWTSIGPGHGIQLGRGQRHGRLVIPGEHENAERAGAQLYVSDDGGLTWSTGAFHDATTAVPFPRELSVVERTDGTLYVNARSSAECGFNERRLSAVVTDGGASFTAAGFTPVAGLDSPPVYGSLLRLSATDTGGADDRILFSAPLRSGGSTVEDRRDLTLRSVDEKGAWSANGTVVVPGLAGYSDLTLTAPKTVGMLYETAQSTPHGSIRFTAFTADDLDENQTPVRRQRTPDSAGDHTDSPTVVGAPVLTPRSTGTALAFDGTADALRTTSCSPDLAVGSGDFTVTAWFRYTATGGNHPILWAYGMGDDAPQFWLRAEPGADKIHAVVDTGTAAAAGVSVAGAHNDGRWHSVVLTRKGAQLRLSVDDGPAATNGTAGGAITPLGGAPATTLHIGARPDGLQHFQGALGDLRLFATALDADQAAQAREGATVTGAAERVRLRMETLG
ncbi:exo-alpha-sialidase [Streptomyces sp. NPDC090127]|uniref:exo-alpha-sialidase n=1 Tax=Streptomyces sp. NPDC090127 TaxID=3365953 RepID=UPI00380B90F0